MKSKHRGRPKIENPKNCGAHVRLNVSEKERLDECRTKYNVTVADILKLGMDYLKILNKVLEDKNDKA